MTDKNVTPATDERIKRAFETLKGMLGRMPHEHRLGGIVAIDNIAARIDADAKVIEELRAVDQHLTSECERLLSVVGPPMPCGHYACEMTPCNGCSADVLCTRCGAWNQSIPEYRAWRESRQKGR